MEPAMLHLLCQRYARGNPADPDPVTLLKNVENKAYEEFFQDIVPILTLRTNEDRKRLRHATLGVCDSSIVTFLGAETTEFFNPFIVKFNNSNQNIRHIVWNNELQFLNLDPQDHPLPSETWGIKHSIFSIFIQRIITPDGHLKKLDYLQFHNGLYATMNQLVLLGEQINTLRRLTLEKQITPDQAVKLKTADQIITDFFQKHSIDAAVYIKRLESFRKRHPHPHHSNTHIPNPAGLSVYSMWLREWRNTLSHLNILSETAENLLDELSKELPPHITDLQKGLETLFPRSYF